MIDATAACVAAPACIPQQPWAEACIQSSRVMGCYGEPRFGRHSACTITHACTAMPHLASRIVTSWPNFSGGGCCAGANTWKGFSPEGYLEGPCKYSRRLKRPSRHGMAWLAQAAAQLQHSKRLGCKPAFYCMQIGAALCVRLPCEGAGGWMQESRP